jgi:hypothetical protein
MRAHVVGEHEPRPRVGIVPGQRALALVRVLVPAERLRAVELAPAVVAREQLRRLGLGRRRPRHVRHENDDGKLGGAHGVLACTRRADHPRKEVELNRRGASHPDAVITVTIAAAATGAV